MTVPESDGTPVDVTDLTQRYDRAAAVYRELWAPILRSAALPLVRELASADARRVLDVGTGVGALLPDLQSAFPASTVMGVDLSRGMLGLAPERYGRALMDARCLAVPGACMDRVFLMFMLFHLDRPDLALGEARRVLSPGGRIGTLTWVGHLDSRASLLWGECLDQHGAIPRDAANEARHEAVGAPDKMEAWLRGAGFTDVRAWHGEVVSTIEADSVIRLWTHLGSSKPRFDSLEPAAAAACVAEARRRMGDLTAEDFIARAGLVYSVATQPA